MSMPEQVRKQVEEANRLIETHLGTGEGSEATAQQDGESPVAPETAAEVRPEVSATDAPVKSESPPAQAAPQEDENSPTYKQRWLSLQGQWNTLRGQNEQLLSRVGQLEQLITTIQSSPQLDPVQAAPTASDPTVTQQDVEAFGEDMVDFAKRVSRQENAALRAELERTQRTMLAMEQRLNGIQQVVPTVQQVAQNQRMTAEQGFFASLSQVVPHWEAVNASPKFHQWLLTPDPMTGITRQTYLEDAQKSLDVERVVSIFTAFAPSAPEPVRPSRAASELERQISPGRSMAASSPATQEARRWSRAEIAKLYSDKQHGAFKGREAEFKELERDIFAAQKEGRVAA